MASSKTGSKKSSKKAKTGRGLEIENAAEMLREVKKNELSPDLAIDLPEQTLESLTEGSKKVLETILTDIFPEQENAPDSAVVAGIKKACQRAQDGSDAVSEITFWRHVADPGFMKVVKDTGAALIGMHILPLIATLLNMAIQDKNTWALKTSLQIAGLLPTKYDIYQLRYEERHVQNFSGEVNFGGKTDQELKDICAQVYDEPETAEANG